MPVINLLLHEECSCMSVGTSAIDAAVTIHPPCRVCVSMFEPLCDLLFGCYQLYFTSAIGWCFGVCYCACRNWVSHCSPAWLGEVLDVSDHPYPGRRYTLLQPSLPAWRFGRVFPLPHWMKGGRGSLSMCDAIEVQDICKFLRCNLWPFVQYNLFGQSIHCEHTL